MSTPNPPQRKGPSGPPVKPSPAPSGAIKKVGWASPAATVNYDFNYSGGLLSAPSADPVALTLPLDGIVAGDVIEYAWDLYVENTSIVRDERDERSDGARGRRDQAQEKAMNERVFLGGRPAIGFGLGAIERRNPLPAGSYWVDVFAQDLPAFQSWLSANSGSVRVTSTEHFDSDPPRDWFAFTVTSPVQWNGPGLPTISQGETTSAETSQRPPPPPDVTTQITESLQGASNIAKWIGVAAAVTVVVVGGALIVYYVPRRKPAQQQQVTP